MRKFDYIALKEKKWDSEIISLLSQIHEHKGRQDVFIKQKPEQLEKLVDVAKRQSTEASNAIEGIRTTSSRLKQLCEEKTTPKNRAEEEILGYREVLNTIHESYDFIPLRSNYILQLHRDLYRYTEKNIGGKYKISQNVIAARDENGKEYVLFTPLAPYETPKAIDEICENYNKMIENDEIDALLLIPIFIHDFLCIHPFSDGNGRMSRLLTALLLYKSGYVIGKYISIESKIAKNKDLYYQALEECQEGWHENEEDATPFIKYMLRIILAAYRDFEERVEIIGEKLPAKEIVRRAVYSKIGKIYKNDIVELCPQISVKSVEVAIRQLTEEGTLIKYGSGRATYYIRGDAK